MGISFIPDDQVNFTEARLSLGKQIAQICTFCGRTTKTEECRGWRFDRTSTGYCAVCRSLKSTETYCSQQIPINLKVWAVNHPTFTVELACAR